MAAVTDPHAWHRTGLACLARGELDAAAFALEQAEQRGLADAAYALGLAYRAQGRQDAAEQAWLRVLERTSSPGLRRGAAARLAGLYRDLGSPQAFAELRAYHASLRQGLVPRRPPARVRHAPPHGYTVQGRARLAGWLAGRWQAMPAARRLAIAGLSGLGALAAMAEHAAWLAQLLRR